MDQQILAVGRPGPIVGLARVQHLYEQAVFARDDAANDLSIDEAIESVDISDLEDFYREAKEQFDLDETFRHQARSRVVELHKRTNDLTMHLWRHIVEQSRRHYQPIYDLEHRPVGMLYVGVLAQKYHDLTLRNLSTFALVTLGALLVAGIVGWRLAGSVSRPVSRLASASADRTARIWDAVPYPIRWNERQVILAARPEAERIVSRLWQELKDWRSVAERLRQDTDLSEPVRRAALNEVLRRATGHRQD